ncbi:MAG: DNA-directed RNA polymerase subunit H [Halobacteria archaeon]
MRGVDVTKHEMVPEHVVLDEDEIEEVTERYDIDKTDLPKISRVDSPVKQLDADTGDVVKIIRESLTTDEAVTYRIIVDN